MLNSGAIVGVNLLQKSYNKLTPTAQNVLTGEDLFL